MRFYFRTEQICVSPADRGLKTQEDGNKRERESRMRGEEGEQVCGQRGGEAGEGAEGGGGSGSCPH